MQKRYPLIIALFILITGFWVPEQHVIPVQNAKPVDWNPKSFWYYPWGRSGTHKGIDIFARKHTPVLATSEGLIIKSGRDSLGGNVVYILSAKWRLHYYAHLQDIEIPTYQWVKSGQRIGTVGDSGNAKGKPPHLHYSIKSFIPRPWAANPQIPHGWRKMFYINPNEFLAGHTHG